MTGVQTCALPISPVKEPTAEEKAKYWDEMDKQTAGVVKQKEERVRREIVEPPKEAAGK